MTLTPSILTKPNRVLKHTGACTEFDTRKTDGDSRAGHMKYTFVDTTVMLCDVRRENNVFELILARPIMELTRC